MYKTKAIFLTAEKTDYTSKKDGSAKTFHGGSFLVNGSLMQFSLTPEQFKNATELKTGVEGDLELDVKAFQGKPYIVFSSFSS